MKGDVRDILGAVRVPTLVLARPAALEESRYIAARRAAGASRDDGFSLRLDPLGVGSAAIPPLDTGRLTRGRIPAEIVYGARKVRAR